MPSVKDVEEIRGHEPTSQCPNCDHLGTDCTVISGDDRIRFTCQKCQYTWDFVRDAQFPQKTEEAQEILDAIGGMCMQYGATGSGRTKLMQAWPRSRALLLDALMMQLADAADDCGRIDEDCCSAQECAIAVLLKHGLVEEVRHGIWWPLGSRDTRANGFYLRRDRHAQMMAEAFIV